MTKKFYRKVPLKARFDAKWDEDPITGCWIWRGAVTTKGYGTMGDGKYGTVSAHRAAYMLYNGPIPNDYEVHHLCNVPFCVNPAHLMALSREDHAKTRRKK